MAVLTNVNIFLSAKTKLDLVALQILNNQINGIMYGYQTPVFDGKEWVVWFTADVTEWHDPARIKEDKLNIEGI